MNILVGVIIGGLIQAAGSLVGRILLSLGIGYVAYTGIDASITFAKNYVFQQLGQLGANTLAVMGVLKLGSALNMLLSAVVVRLSIAGLTSGTLKRFTVK